MDGDDLFRCVESVEVAATATLLYDLVTDIGRTGEWSPICQTCWWRDGDGPWPGAWFFGRNEAGGRTWETKSQVVVATPGEEFAWLVGGKFVRWGFRFAPRDAALTTVTESWHFLPAGREMFAAQYGEAAPKRIALRSREAREGIPMSLAALKQIAELSAM